MDLLTKLLDILCDDFCILMDYVETEVGSMVFSAMQEILGSQGISCRSIRDMCRGQRIGMLVSEGWKYAAEY